MIIQSRQGGHFRIPLERLADFTVPEGTVVIEWRPGRYLVVPLERLDEFRMSDEELLPMALEARVQRRGGRAMRGRSGGGPRRRR
ncbi:MAG TPA: hypothetical protein VJ794_03375 [Gemmatimonadales bacterium]|nr:hypothetical protein [Gemmatimonadales bacterium]